MIPGPIAFALLVPSFVGTLTFINFLATRKIVHPEVSRKALHISMGLVALSFPWLFPEPTWFFVSFSTIIGILALVKFQPGVRNLIGRALYNVERRSGGEIYFALTIVALYVVARDNIALYSIPILVMTVADAFAALVGTFYGKATYLTRGGHKSWEGSVIFFFVAFMVIHIAIHLLTDFAPLDAVSITFCLAFVATAIEGGSWEGLDNLFLPLVTFFLLDGFLRKIDLDQPLVIGIQSNLAVIGFALLGVFVNKTIRIRSDAIMAMVAFGYLFWASQGFDLLLPGLMTGLCFLGVTLGRDRGMVRKIVDGQIVTAVCLPAAIPLMLHMRHIEFDIHFTVYLTFAASASLVVNGVLANQLDTNFKNNFRMALIATVMGLAYGLAWALITQAWGAGTTIQILSFVLVSIVPVLLMILMKSAPRTAQISSIFLWPMAIAMASVFFSS